MCAVISPKVRIGCDRVRPNLVSRCSYLVNRKNASRRTRLLGFEADPNASGGGKMSEANGSEGGRLRRRSESDVGEKESHPFRHESYVVTKLEFHYGCRRKPYDMSINAILTSRYRLDMSKIINSQARKPPTL